jgi:hypothetical protein
MRHAPCKTTHKQQPAGFAKSCHGLPPCFQTTPLFPVCCLDCCHVDVCHHQSEALLQRLVRVDHFQFPAHSQQTQTGNPALSSKLASASLHAQHAQCTAFSYPGGALAPASVASESRQPTAAAAPPASLCPCRARDDGGGRDAGHARVDSSPRPAARFEPRPACPMPRPEV